MKKHLAICSKDVLRLYGKKVADKYYNKFLEFTIELDDNSIKEANEFKLKNKKKKLSYIDCIGYILAKKRNVKFLTGDKEFKEFENVEFVP